MSVLKTRHERHRFPRPFGPFTLEKQIGKGSRSIVYLACDNRDKETVALKILPETSTATLELQRAAVKLEARRLRVLSHPNIIALRQHGEIDEIPYLSFPHIAGRGLAEILTDKDLLLAPLLESMLKVCSALGHAHSRGLIHRDLKPHNIIFDQRSEPHVIDWGLSWVRGEKPEPHVQTIVGTPAYMSPEQARGEEQNLSFNSDVYSLGAIMYHVVTGKPPFVADTSWKTMQMAMSLPPHPPSKLRTTIDLKLERVILWCLQKEPEKRYADGAELAEDLQRAIESSTPQGPAGFLDRLFKKKRK